MAPRSTGSFAVAIAAFVATGWLGMLVGVSFLATPVKFQAPSLDLSVALEVGRVTFAAFSKVEWALSVALAAAALLPSTLRTERILAAAAVLIVAVQSLWLLPVLDVRIDAVTAGQPMPPSMHHMLYAAMEVVKAAALAAVALLALFRLGWLHRSEELRSGS